MPVVPSARVTWPLSCPTSLLFLFSCASLLREQQLYHCLVRSGQEDVSSLILMTFPVISQPLEKEVVGQYLPLLRLVVETKLG